MRPHRLVLVLALALAGGAWTGSAAELTQQANEAYRAGRFAEAAAGYREALAKRPSAEVALNLGHALLRLEQFAQAADAYRQALELKPDLADGEWFLAQALHRGGHHDEAIKLLLRAVPRRNEAHLWLGQAYERLGDPTAAETAYRTGALRDPASRVLREALAVLYLRQGRYAEAERVCAGLVRRFPDDAKLKKRLAEARAAGLAERAAEAYQLERFARAAQLYTQAAEALPSAEMFVNLAVCRLRAEEPARAADACRKALALDPRRTDAKVHLGRALLDAGRAKEAVGPLREALEAQPAQATALLLGQTHEQLGEPKAAEAVYRRAAGGKLEHEQAARALAALYANTQRLEQASEIYVALCRRHPDDEQLARRCAQLRAALAVERGNAAFAKGQLEPARRHFEASLATLPNADAWLNLGHTLVALRRHDDAVAAYRRVLELDATRTDVRWPLAQALYQAGELQAAAAAFRLAIEQRPREQASLLLGRCYELLDDPALARVVLERGLVRFPASRSLREALAALHVKQGRPARAAELYAALARRLPGDTQVLRSLAQFQLASGQAGRAIDTLEAVRRLAPGDLSVCQGLADLYLSQGMHREAAEMYRLFLAAAERPTAEDFFRLGHAWFQAGELVSATEALGKALALDKAHAHSHLTLGHMLAREGKTDAAAAAYRAALAAEPTLTAGHLALGGLLLERKAYAAAAGHYRLALAQGAGEPVVYRNAVIALLRSGDRTAARATLKEALRRHPAHPDLADLHALFRD